jgi:hypothetical protein
LEKDVCGKKTCRCNQQVVVSGVSTAFLEFPVVGMQATPYFRIIADHFRNENRMGVIITAHSCNVCLSRRTGCADSP